MEDKSTYIDSFFNKELDQNEKEVFEARIKADELFAEEVAEYVKTKYAFKKVSNDLKKEEFNQILKSKQRIKVSLKYWLAAASILIVSVFSWWFVSKPNLETLAANYTSEKLSQLSSNMAGNTDSFQKGIQSYNIGKYEEAAEIFKGINTPDAIANTGLSYLKMAAYEKAIEQFEKLEKMSLLANPGSFYKALTLIERNKNDDLQQAKILLEKVKTEKLEGWQEIEKWGI
jgi:tetratricopeptide (TPR) repeat protein